MNPSDVLVIGGGPAGSTAATLLARKGHSVILLEREHFPRFQIGESLLPFNNPLFEELGVLDALRNGAGFPKCGAEFVTADGAVGHTFRFASYLPREYGRAFQVERAKLDDALLGNAAASGVEVREGVSVRDVAFVDDGARIEAVSAEHGTESFQARFVVDASGNGSVVGTRFGGRREEPTLRKISFFAHYRGVAPSAEGEDAGNTVISILRDGWFWLIPLSHEITSVGLVMNRDDYLRSGLQPEEILSGAIDRAPYIARRMANAERASRVYARKDFSFRMDRVVGPRYVLTGDAAGFFDPIFSTGVFMAMKSAAVAAGGVDHWLRTGDRRELSLYQRSLRRALDRYFSFIEGFYRREFLEVFLNPQERFGLIPVVIGILAGNVFDDPGMRLRLRLFFALSRIQRRWKVIAPPIAWDTLPGTIG